MTARPYAAGFANSPRGPGRAIPRANVDRFQATPKPGQVPTERHRATPSDARNVTGGQGVAGSNPAVPTGSDIFSNTLLPYQCQQTSHSFVTWPFYRRAPLMYPG